MSAGQDLIAKAERFLRTAEKAIELAVKNFVIETFRLITMGNISKSLYPEIVAHEKQGKCGRHVSVKEFTL